MSRGCLERGCRPFPDEKGQGHGSLRVLWGTDTGCEELVFYFSLVFYVG